MWISWCITQICRKISNLIVDKFSKRCAQENVDNVDNMKIEQIFCATCLVDHNWGKSGDASLMLIFYEHVE